MPFKTSDNTVVSSDNTGCFPPRSKTGLACTRNTYIQYIPGSYTHFKKLRKEIKGKKIGPGETTCYPRPYGTEE